MCNIATRQTNHRAISFVVIPSYFNVSEIDDMTPVTNLQGLRPVSVDHYRAFHITVANLSISIP